MLGIETIYDRIVNVSSAAFKARPLPAMPPKVEPEPVPIDEDNETSAKGGGCCCCKGKVGPDGPVKVDPAFWTNKKCHDFSFCILFLVFWVGMIFVLMMAATNGNGNGVESLVYGKDWQAASRTRRGPRRAVAPAGPRSLCWPSQCCVSIIQKQSAVAWGPGEHSGRRRGVLTCGNRGAPRQGRAVGSALNRTIDPEQTVGNVTRG